MESGDKASKAFGSEESDYVGVNLPRNLMREVDTLLAEHPEMGFQSRSEFVKQGTRSMLAWAHEFVLRRRQLGLEAPAPTDEPMRRFQEAQAGKPIRRRGRGSTPRE